MPYCFARSSSKFQGHTGQNITDFDPNWAFPDYRPVAAFKSLRFALFFQCWKKKKIQKLAGLWLVGEVVNHVGLYGSKVAEGCSAFQRRSCCTSYQPNSQDVLCVKFFFFFIPKSLMFAELFSCDQAALWMVQSVRLSVTPYWLCSHHRIIMKFSGVITSDRSDVHAKGQGQRSRSQRSQPNFTVSGL